MDKTRLEIEEKEKKIIREVPKGLLKWYDFAPRAKSLYVGKETDSYAEALFEANLDLLCVPIEQLLDAAWVKGNRASFKYLIIVANFEAVENPSVYFKALSALLVPDGKLLLGMNNRLGLRYFLGDKDIYTNQLFDGIENYRRAYSKKEDGFVGRMYAKSEMLDLILESGLKSTKFYSVFPDLEHPQMLFADGYIPQENLARRLFPMYHNTETVFLEEQYLYKNLMDNNIFHAMANAYFVEVGFNDDFSDVNQVTSTLERDVDKAMLTIVHGNNCVEKRAVFLEGKKQLEQIIENQNALKERGIRVVESRLEGMSLRMPYINAPSAQEYFEDLLRNDKEKFLHEMDRYRDMILQASDFEHTLEAGELGPLQKKAYPDMGFINCFVVDGEFVLFDQEFTIECCPVKFPIYRMIWGFHLNDPENNSLIPIDELWERYEIKDCLAEMQKMDGKFINGVRNDSDLRFYHAKYRANLATIYANRQRMNFSLLEYRKKFIDIFDASNEQKIILFGSGKFAEKYMTVYAKDYPVYAVVDNNEKRWGQAFGDLIIQSPDFLHIIQDEEYKVYICIKNYTSVAKQLEKMGISDYAIFDANMDYPRKLRAGITENAVKNEDGVFPEKKPYHIGYVAGVFDMFHVGHLNLLRKAKEQCEYLIVGVLDDEEVYNQKNKYPVIPIADRVEVLKSVRYVDQVEVLPVGFTSIREAYNMFHFDAQFSGDDHGESASWDADGAYLKERGAELVFVNYTEKVSSTMLREKLIRGNI